MESVEIHCRFPNDDAGKLRLIDLPGLGDTRLGDAGRVVNALKDQVDLVLFLSKPSNTGAGWQDIDTDLYRQARSALGEKLPINHWSFWVFNHDSRSGADNRIQCRLLCNSIDGAQIKVAKTVIVDCTNYDDVSEKLIGEALSYLSENIGRNDLEYAGNLQDMLKSAVVSGLSSGRKDISGRPIRFSFCEIFSSRAEAYAAFNRIITQWENTEAKIQSLFHEEKTEYFFEQKNFIDWLQAERTANPDFDECRHGDVRGIHDIIWPSHECVIKWLHSEADEVFCL